MTRRSPRRKQPGDGLVRAALAVALVGSLIVAIAIAILPPT